MCPTIPYRPGVEYEKTKLCIALPLRTHTYSPCHPCNRLAHVSRNWSLKPWALRRRISRRLDSVWVGLLLARPASSEAKRSTTAAMWVVSETTTNWSMVVNVLSVYVVLSHWLLVSVLLDAIQSHADNTAFWVTYSSVPVRWPPRQLVQGWFFFSYTMMIQTCSHHASWSSKFWCWHCLVLGEHCLVIRWHQWLVGTWNGSPRQAQLPCRLLLQASRCHLWRFGTCSALTICHILSLFFHVLF